MVIAHIKCQVNKSLVVVTLCIDTSNFFLLGEFSHCGDKTNWNLFFLKVQIRKKLLKNWKQIIKLAKPQNWGKKKWLRV